MTTQEINDLYNQIEDLSDTQLEDILLKEFYPDEDVAGLRYAFGLCAGSFNWFSGKTPRSSWTPEKAMDVCKQFLFESSDSIRRILMERPKTANCTLEIIQFVAPMIAQQYVGMSGLAIVGILSILCKQGITNYIKV